MSKRSGSSRRSAALIVVCGLLSACAESWYRSADRGYCTNQEVCRHEVVYEQKTFSEIEREFLRATPKVRAELLVFGFDHWHHKPNYLLDAFHRLPFAERRNVAEIVLELSSSDRLRQIAEQVLSDEHSTL